MSRGLKISLIILSSFIALSLITHQIYSACLYTPGDANGDGKIVLSDVVYIINSLFKSGPAPNPLCRGDANADGKIVLSDVVYIINNLFKAGPAPVASGDCCLGTNQAPVCDSLWANPNPVGLGQTTTLTCLAQDPDGDSLTYSWNVGAGTLSGSGPVVTWTADGICCPGIWAIACTVTDGKGGVVTGFIQMFVI